LHHADELRLARTIAEFPAEVSAAAAARAPHRIAHFCRELAGIFHQFYGTCRVVDPQAPELSRARLALVVCARTVIANCLRLLGVSAPDRM